MKKYLSREDALLVHPPMLCTNMTKEKVFNYSELQSAYNLGWNEAIKEYINNIDMYSPMIELDEEDLKDKSIVQSSMHEFKPELCRKEDSHD